MATANPLLTAGIAATVAAAAAVGYLAYEWYETEQAVKHATGEMIIAGTAQMDSANQIRNSIQNLRTEWNAGQSDARKSVLAVSGLAGAAGQYRDQILQIAAAYAHLTGSDLAKTTEAITQKFAEGGRGALEWANRLNLLNPAQKQTAEAAEKAGQDIQVMAAVIGAANSRFVSHTKNVNDATAAWNAYNSQMEVYRASGGNTPVPIKPSMPPPAPGGVDQSVVGKEPNVQNEEDLESVSKLDDATQKLVQLNIELAAAKRAAAHASNPQEEIAAQNAILAAQAKIAEVHTFSQQQAHDITMGQLQQEEAADRDHTAARIADLQKIAQEEARYYGANSAQARSAQDRVVEAQREGADKALQIHLAQLAGEQEADKDNLAAQIGVQNQKLALLRAAGKADSLEYQSELNQKISLEREAADQSVKIQVDKLREQQEAAGRSFEQQLAIEDQILGILKAHYGEESTEYQAEAQKRVEIKRREAEQEAQIAEQAAETMKNVNASITDAMNAVAKAGAVSRAGLKGGGGIAALLGVDDSSVQEAKAKLAELTAAYTSNMQMIKAAQAAAAGDPSKMQAALDQEIEANYKFVADVIAANAEAAAASEKAWQQSVDSTLSGVNSAVAKMITGYETVSKAALTVATDIAQHMIEASLKMVERWVEDRIFEAVFGKTIEAEKTAAAQLGASARIASSTVETTTVSTQQALMASRAAAAQATMTGATTTGVATRTAVEDKGILADIGQFVARAARWVASELGMTSSTVQGNQVRSASNLQAAASSQVQLASNVTLAMSYAAVGAVAAGASVAAIPVTGWSMAPGVSASTYADLSKTASLASLDVGAYDVPRDMVAQIHAGEMVIPKTFAEGLRDSGAAGGYSGSSDGMHIHYSPSLQGGGDMGNATQAAIARVLDKSHQDLIHYLTNVTRNGNLNIPGRKMR
jgi:hypothetical protein